MPQHDQRLHLIATLLSGATTITTTEGGPYLWASLGARSAVPQLVEFARDLADEILRQEQAAATIPTEGGLR